MPQPIRIRSARFSIAIAVSILLLAGPAIADDRPWEQDSWTALETGYPSGGEDSALGKRWLDYQLNTDERYGFEFSRSLYLRLDKRLILSIQGPLVRERAPGLAFELRF